MNEGGGHSRLPVRHAEDDGLSIVERRVVCALLEAPTIKDAALLAQCSRSTVHRCLRRRHVLEALDARASELYGAGLSRLKASFGECLGTLLRALRGEAISDKQLHAATELLRHALGSRLVAARELTAAAKVATLDDDAFERFRGMLFGTAQPASPRKGAFPRADGAEPGEVIEAEIVDGDRDRDGDRDGDGGGDGGGP